jgi:hypothetical protein
MSRLILRLGVLSVAAIVVFVVYHRLFLNLSNRADSSKAAAVAEQPDKSSGRTYTPVRGAVNQGLPEGPAWMIEARTIQIRKCA